MMTNSPKLLDRMRDAIRRKHYSIRTEDAYVDWAKRFILFHDKRHPREMGVPEIEAFLTHLAVDKKVAASTQNQHLTHKCSSQNTKLLNLTLYIYNHIF